MGFKERPVADAAVCCLLAYAAAPVAGMSGAPSFALPWACLALACVCVPMCASGVPSRRLRVLHAGVAMLRSFLVATAFATASFLMGWRALGWEAPRLFAFGIRAFLILAAWFWAGIALAYLTSVQLGIRKRIVGALVGMIPVAHLMALADIIRTCSAEVAFESAKEWADREREGERVCATRYPLLLVHGVFFRDFDHLGYWGRIPAELERNGAVVYYGGQMSAASVRVCARQIGEQIERVMRETGAEKVNVIAHSKGGLDVRYAATCLGMAPHIASITTINTPHRGCEFADYMLGHAPEGFRRGLAEAYEGAARRLGDEDPDFIEAVTDLTASGASALNAEMEAALGHPWQDGIDGIVCQSTGSALRKATGGRFPLNVTHGIVGLFDGRNDGLVGEKSFPWGSGFQMLENRVSDRGISHGDMIDLNRENIDGFDVREFYVRLVSGLRARGL